MLAYHRLSTNYHPDRNDDPKDEFKMPMINDAKDKVLEWRARPQGAGAAAGVALVKMKKKMDRSNVTFYCTNESNMAPDGYSNCTFNRKHKDYKAGDGGVKHRYEKGTVDPYQNADTAPPVVCAQCAAAGFPNVEMIPNVRKKKEK